MPTVAQARKRAALACTGAFICPTSAVPGILIYIGPGTALAIAGLAAELYRRRRRQTRRSK